MGRTGSLKSLCIGTLSLGFEYLLWQSWADVEAFIKAHRHQVEDSVKIGGTI